MKRRQILLILILIAATAAAFWLAAYLREPRARGYAMSYWMEEYALALDPPGGPAPADHRRADRAIEAIRAMGPSGVRALLRRMNSRDSTLKLKFIEWSRKQSLVQIQHQPAEYRRQWAVAALCDLGPSASVALPRITAWLSDAELSSDASKVMASIGSASVPVLISSLANTNDRIRYRAAEALGWIGRDAAPAVPALMAVLQETNPFPRSGVIRSLGAIGVPEKEIEQCLIGLLQEPAGALDAAYGLARLGGDSLRPLILALTNSEPKVLLAGLTGLMFWHEANKRLAPSEARELRTHVQRLDLIFNLKALGAGFANRSRSPDVLIARTLAPTLTNTNPRLRALSAIMLAQFPGGAQHSVPALKLALKDEDATVREAARKSLDRLPAPAPSTNALPLSLLPTPATL